MDAIMVDLLSRFIKVCLKKTVKWFHVFLFSEQHMVGQVLENLKAITEAVSFYNVHIDHDLK